MPYRYNVQLKIRTISLKYSVMITFALEIVLVAYYNYNKQYIILDNYIINRAK